MNKYIRVACITAITATLLVTSLFAQRKTVRLGYFEAGEHPIHNLLRKEFYRQLRALSPDSLDVVFVPQGYGSGDWKRDSCRVLARALSGRENLDLIVTIGPWVVEDLLEADCRIPILAMHQLDPEAAGFVAADGRPAIDNLTVHTKPGKIEDDLAMLNRLAPIDTLGFLFFPADSAEREGILARVRTVGRQLGIEVSYGKGFDNSGTYAFFKAAQNLPENIDAVYLGPLWGMDIQKINAFLQMFVSRRIPVFTYEGRFLVERGAFGTNTGYGIVSEGRFNALKAMKIIEGVAPAVLPVAFRSGNSLVLNGNTADQCGIEIPLTVRNEAVVIEAPPSTESATYLTLSEAITRGLNANPGYLATYDALEQAAHSVGQALAAYLPHIYLSGRAGYVDDNTVHNTNEPIDNNQYGAALSLQQSILSLETIKDIGIAKKKQRLSVGAQNQARLDLELGVRAAVFAYVRSQYLLEIHRRFHQIVERNLELAATWHYVEGERLADFIRWQSERQHTLAGLALARAEVNITRTIFNTLLNQPPDRTVNLDTTALSQDRLFADIAAFEPHLQSAASLEQLKAAVLDRVRTANIEMQQYDRRLDLQRAAVSRNTARFFPSLDLRARVNWADELTDTIPGFDERHDTWSVFGELSLPLFLGLDRSRERSRLKAQLSELEYQRDAAGLKLAADVRRKLEHVVALTGAIPKALRMKELALQNLDIMSTAYEAGEVGLADFLEIYNHARQAEVAAIDRRFEFYSLSAELIHLAGLSGSAEYRDFHDLYRELVQGR